MITDFLKTERDRKELKIALEVIKEFKKGEDWDEWLGIPFAAWAKLEQLEEFLEALVNGAPLKQDTLLYMQREV